jgi:hypothetical protein
MIDLSELRRVAEAAMAAWDGEERDRQAELNFDHTFSPPTVLALLRVVEAAEAEDHDPLCGCNLCFALHALKGAGDE